MDLDLVSMHRGRLGITMLEDLNATLIVKWFYKFANERDTFWRRVVSVKGGVDRSQLLPIVTRSVGNLLFST